VRVEADGEAQADVGSEMRVHHGMTAVSPSFMSRQTWTTGTVGSQQAGERSAVPLGLVESAKLNGRDPWAYLKDMFDRLPALKQRDLAQLLAHLWQAPIPLAAATMAKLVAA